MSYAFLGNGSFSATHFFGNIQKLESTGASTFDTTGAVELLVDVNVFNAYIGLYKDASNINIDYTRTDNSNGFYDNFTDQLTIDQLTFSHTDLQKGLTPSCVQSVGNLKNIYSDFALYVASYFGLPTVNSPAEGFATLFAGDFGFSINNGIFDEDEFISIITKSTTDPSGGYYTQDISGSVTLDNITKLLRSASSNNTFGNRDPVTGTTAENLFDKRNYGVTDGFLEGDLLFIPNSGIEITLSLLIAPTSFKNSKAVIYGLDTQTAQDSSGTYTSTTDPSNNVTTFSQATTATDNSISRVIKVPLLIRLTNLTLPYISKNSFSNTTGEVVLNIQGIFDVVNVYRYHLDPSGNKVVDATFTATVVSVNDNKNKFLHNTASITESVGTGTWYYEIQPSNTAEESGYPYFFSTTTI
jgi:hypothetical protein